MSFDDENFEPVRKAREYQGTGGLGSNESMFDHEGTKIVKNKRTKKITKQIAERSNQYNVLIQQYLSNIDAKMQGLDTSPGSPNSPFGEEVMRYIEKFKKEKNIKLRNKDTKIKVCVLYYLISRKNNAGYSLSDIIEAVPKRALSKKAAEKQRKSHEKQSRVKNELAPFRKMQILLQQKYSEFMIDVSKRPDQISKFVSFITGEENLSRKLTIKVNSKMEKINKKSEFTSKSQNGKIATIIYLSIKELKEKGYEFDIYKQIDICRVCKINQSTMRTNMRDFKNLF